MINPIIMLIGFIILLIVCFFEHNKRIKIQNELGNYIYCYNKILEIIRSKKTLSKIKDDIYFLENTRIDFKLIKEKKKYND